MARTPRRGFLASLASLTVPAALALLAAGRLVSARARAQGLGQFQVPTAGCKDDEKATPAGPEGPDFKQHSPGRASLLEAGLTGQKLVLTGTVTGLTCGRVKGALVDFWQADARGVYDANGFRLRGHQLTSADGGYRLETIVPGPHADRARHLHVRVQPPGKPTLTTQLFFPGEPENAHDPVFRPELVMKVVDGRDGKSASFNFVLNI